MGSESHALRCGRRAGQADYRSRRRALFSFLFFRGAHVKGCGVCAQIDPIPPLFAVLFAVRQPADAPGAPAGYYVERIGDGQVATIPEWVRVRFDQDLNALCDKHLFACDQAAEVSKVTYECGDGTSFSLLKSGDKWTMEPAPPRPLKDNVVERTVSGLASLAGKDIVAEDATGADKLAAYGLDAPVAQVEVARADGTSCGRALAGVVSADTDNPAYYLKRANAGTVESRCGAVV